MDIGGILDFGSLPVGMTHFQWRQKTAPPGDYHAPKAFDLIPQAVAQPQFDHLKPIGIGGNRFLVYGGTEHLDLGRATKIHLRLSDTVEMKRLQKSI